MKAYEIEWDVDDPEDLAFLPTEVKLPDCLTHPDDIADYLSELTGFCHKGFQLTDQ